MSVKFKFIIRSSDIIHPSNDDSIYFILEHGPINTIALALNKLTNFRLGDLFDTINIKTNNPRVSLKPIYYGGEHNIEKLFILHGPTNYSWRTTIKLTPDIFLTTSIDILESIADEKPPKKYQVILGYKSWKTEEFDKATIDGNNIIIAACPEILFNTPTKLKWLKATQLAGLDITQFFHNPRNMYTTDNFPTIN